MCSTMIGRKILFMAIFINVAIAVQYLTDPTSEISSDDKNVVTENITQEQSGEMEPEMETESDDKGFLEEALKIVSNPFSVLKRNYDVIKQFKLDLENITNENDSVKIFFNKMDNLALDVCKSSQKSLWSYVLDPKNELAKSNMINIAAEEDEIKIEYWDLLKDKYLKEGLMLNDTRLNRKIRIIKLRGINLKILQSKEPNDIDTMHHIWSLATVCAYNATVCTKETLRTMNDIIKIFKTCNDTKELTHYWKTYRDATGRKIRPIFENYVLKTNRIAVSENFTDIADMWHSIFDDKDFINTVETIWNEIKPLYQALHNYVRLKLKSYHADEFTDDSLIPAHLLGNLWAQEWQAIYRKLAFYPDAEQTTLVTGAIVNSTALFDAIDNFHQSLGFNSSRASYQDIFETSGECFPSSHDLCDGINYKIKWCDENATDIADVLSKASRLLSHIQYFKHYRNLELVFRDGPNPAFHNAISDVFTSQVMSPEYLKTLNYVKIDTGNKATLNRLLKIALEKLPMVAYAYTLDKWRWDIFTNTSLRNWNQHWWDLRIKEMGLSPPVLRDEKDLDAAAKYHVVSHVQYITYLISNVLEFQIMLSLCKRVNHTGPLHECSIYGNKEAGRLLSDGMSLGASESWRTVLKTMTGETELSTEGIRNYFSVLEEHLKEETAKLQINSDGNTENNATVFVGIAVIILIILMFILYFIRNKNAMNKLCSMCGLKQNASLDIVTYEASNGGTQEVASITELKM